MGLTLVLGGTRSGKSAYAESLARASGLPVRYVATADAGDPSMRARIEAHAARRPAEWTTVEAGASLAAALDAPGACVLLDGLGVWLATHDVPGEIDRAIAAAETAIVVAEQAGEGLLPMDRVSRAWLDALGEATQRFAAAADRVVLVTAGRPLELGRPEAAREDGRPAIRSAASPSPSARPADALDSLRRHGDRDVRPGDADHAVNVIAGGTPAWLRVELERALDDLAYPREDEAVAAVAAMHGRGAAEIVPTNGAAEALWLLGPALRPRLAACVHPGFTEAEAGLRAHGAPIVRVLRDPERGFALDPAAVPEDADLVVLGNPASPSGTLDPATAILAVRRPGRVLVVDEAFMDLVPGRPGSLAEAPLDDVIVIRSLTKALAIPGLRAGYAIAPPALAERLRAVRPPWSANTLALAALRAAAGHPGELAAIAERAAREREDLYARLRALGGVRAWPGAANFVLIEVADGPALVAALRDAALAVRPAASFPGLDDRHIRITARTPPENARVATAIAHALRAAA